MSCVPLYSEKKNYSLTAPHTDFGNVENPTPIAVHPHSKNFCAHRAREDRTGHRHALLDSCAGRRSYGARAIQGGAGVHARSAEGYEEACVSKTGQACKARIDCLTTYVYNISFRRKCILYLYSSTFTRQNL
jgi:hypothetical protein